MSKILNILFVFALAVSFGAADWGSMLSAAEKSKSKVQTECPVMGGEINKSIFTDYKGFRIYFCCTGCPGDFKKDPEKYMKKMKESGVVLEKTPK